MKLAIVGTRNPNISYERFCQFVQNYPISEVISGGAKGIDSYAARFAHEKNLPLVEFKPDYSLHGRSAPLVRNSLIVDAADGVIAFPSMSSRGTLDTINKALSVGKIIRVVHIP